MSAIKYAEKGLIPDFLISYGIRRLLKKRLKKENNYYNNNKTDYLKLQIEKLTKLDNLAINTTQANDQHYEVPARFYELTLGKHLKYSSSFYNSKKDSLSTAEENMLELYCKRGEFKDGQDILELGCGWGSLTLYLAKKYPNSTITSISNSNSQREYINLQAEKRGLKNITVKTININEFEINKKFDRIISIEMFEHIRNYPELFNKLTNWLNDTGKIFIHIFCHKFLCYPFEDETKDDWMARNFFTGGMMPSFDLFPNCTDNLKLEKSWKVSGTNYSLTSNDWYKKTKENKKEIIELFNQDSNKNGTIEYNKWKIFYLACRELFGYKNGSEWIVGHYLFTK